MTPQRITLSVRVNLDPVPGTFHDAADVERTLQRMLDSAIPHYDPKVTLIEDTPSGPKARCYSELCTAEATLLVRDYGNGQSGPFSELDPIYEYRGLWGWCTTHDPLNTLFEAQSLS